MGGGGRGPTYTELAKNSKTGVCIQSQYRDTEIESRLVGTAGEREGKMNCIEMYTCSPWGREESDTAEPLHFHFSLSCIGEGDGTHSCTRAWGSQGRGAWWAAVHGVTRSRR